MIDDAERNASVVLAGIERHHGLGLLSATLEDLSMPAASPSVTNLFKQPDDVYTEAYEARRFDLVYFSMMVFSCLIALMGLLLNSPAVIIGAMLISPLMGPILACGLGLTTADWLLGKKALRNLALSISEVVVIAIIATHLSPLRAPTPEIMARTNPNLMDLLIAFFSGLAGTVALASRKTIFTILPGVAIATAVMPPLAIVGYGVATHQWAISGGAFMLFFTNLTAIVLSASLVFLVAGLRPQSERLGHSHELLIRWRIAIAAGVLVVISIPLMRTLLHAAEQSHITSAIKSTLTAHVGSEDRRLSNVSVELVNGTAAVHASIETAKYLEASDVKRIESAIEKRINLPVHLQVSQLQLASKQPGPEQIVHDFVAAGRIPASPPAEEPKSPTAQVQDLQQQLEGWLRGLLAALGITPHIDSVGTVKGGTVVVNVSAEAPHLTSSDMWSLAAAALSQQISAPVKLNVTLIANGSALDLKFKADQQQPSPAQLLEIRQFAASLPQDTEVAVQASADMPATLAEHRRTRLQSALKQTAAEVSIPAPQDGNVISIVPVQRFSLEGGQASKPEPKDAQAPQSDTGMKTKTSGIVTAEPE